MTPERAVAHRCCGPFLLPFSTPSSPRPRPVFLPFRGFLRKRHRNHPPFVSPKIIPSEAVFFAKGGIRIHDSPLKKVPQLPPEHRSKMAKIIQIKRKI